MKVFFLIVTLSVLAPIATQANDDKDKPGGPRPIPTCLYNSKQYTEGAYLCTANDYMQQCLNGGWHTGDNSDKAKGCKGAFNGEKK